MGSFWEALTARRRRTPAEPFVTWYGPGGARAELSCVTYATSVAKTAGMLIDDLAVEPGDRIRLDLPLHWQLPVWLAACDVTGLVVSFPERAARPADMPSGAQRPEREPEPAAITVVAEPVTAPGTTVVVSAATPFGVSPVPVADPLVDHFRAAMGQPDDYCGPIDAGSWAVEGELWDAGRIEAQARALADRAGSQPGARLLVRADTAVRVALACWAVPLLAGGSVVLAGEGDRDEIAAREHVTAWL